MRPIPPALLLALMLLPGTGAAAEGLFLSWNECAPDPTASRDHAFACDVNWGQSELYCAFQVGSPVDSLLGTEADLAVQFSGGVLPDWWRFDVGGCRNGELLGSADFTGRTACAVAYPVVPAVGVVFTPRQPYQDDQARIQAATSFLPGDGFGAVSPGQTYYAVRLIVRNGKTVGAPICSGCSVPACLVLNGIVLRREPGAIGGDVALTVPAPDQGNWATWQGGAGANCASVPARSLSWGRLKALYR